jgi:heme exporter protein B
MPALHAVRAFTWLVVKDLRCEFRDRRVWPTMLLLGFVLVLFLELQLELPAATRYQVVGGLLWLGVFFAGTLALDRSFAGEREEGCWKALLLYPVSSGVLYLAKVAVNLVALFVLEGFLILAAVIFSNAPLLDRPLLLGLVALLGNLGFASVGVLVGASTRNCALRGGVLPLLLLPLITPVLLGAAQATRLLAVGRVDEEWWRWIQLLAAFAVLFTTLGLLVFDFLLED